MKLKNILLIAAVMLPLVGFQTPAAMETMWEQGKAYEKAGKWADTITSMKYFLKVYGKVPAAAEYWVEATWSIAAASKNLGKTKDYYKALGGVVKMYGKAKPYLQAGSTAGDLAAEAQFIITEKDLPKLEAYQVTVMSSELSSASVSSLNASRKKLASGYAKVIAIGSPEWTVAAQFRIGYVLEVQAGIISNAPIPPKVTLYGEAQIAIYKQKIAAHTGPLFEQSRKEYEKVLEYAKTLKVSNTWVSQAKARLGKKSDDLVRPDEDKGKKKGGKKKGRRSFSRTWHP